MKKFILLLLLNTFLNIINAQIYVDIDAIGNNNGTSWTDAYNNLQDAIDAATINTEIWVATGTYLPTKDYTGNSSPTDNRAKVFHVGSDMKIYGGFDGTETLLSQRDWKNNVTILSGDFNNDDSINIDSIVPSFSNNTENAYHVMITANLTTAAIIDGFTIKGGNTNGSSSISYQSETFNQNYGGGIYNSSSSPTIINSIFLYNYATLGAGLSNKNASNSIIVNSIFLYNNANYGGGIYNYTSTPTIINSTFYHNNANIFGGGVRNWNASSSIITNSIFWDNIQDGNNNIVGSDIADNKSTPIVTYCLTQENSTYNNGSGIINNQNPFFIDAVNQNFDLLVSSPAINTGDNTSWTSTGLNTDISGNVRPFNNVVDMGASEYTKLGSITDPFTCLDQTATVTSAGVYYFNIGGVLFDTYVDENGYVQIAIDFGNGIGSLPQGTSLTTTTRGILSPAVLSQLSTIQEVRISSSIGNFDVTTNNSTIINRIQNNTTLHQGLNDNIINDNWTGTNSNYITNDATNISPYNNLNEAIAHVHGNNNGIHWIPINDSQAPYFNGEIGNNDYLQLWVKGSTVIFTTSLPTVIQPTSTIPTGTIIINETISTGILEYSIDNGVTYQTSNTFSGLAPGNYTTKVQKQGSPCTTTYSNYFIVINPSRVYVNLNATGNNNGTSWTDAYNNLQDAIDRNSKEIWVAAGTYLPTKDYTGNSSPTNNRTKVFHLGNDMKIYGGFNGTETLLSQRNWKNNVTILSGDFNNDDIITVDNIVPSFSNNTENAYHVMITANLTTAAIIDGFTIKGGNANISSSITYQSETFNQNYGGGIYNSSSSPTISNLIISYNNASHGGGINNHLSSPIITNSTFFHNNATFGGGIYNNTSTPTITNSTFFHNNANLYGGGVRNWNAASIITNSIFWNNIQNEQNNIAGSDIADNNSSSTPTVTYCLTQENSTYNSGLGIINNQNPSFVDAVNQNFDLLLGSPAIDAGDNTSWTSTGLNTDICGNVRPFNNTVDMGACEYQNLALPVELLFFSAEKQNNNVLLTWQTTTEINNDYFDVEWSLDGFIFEKIGQIQGNGNTTKIQSYDFLHSNPIIGNNYYRLKQVDFDKKYEYSSIKLVNYQSSTINSVLNIYPNPTRGELTIQSTDKIEKITIYNTFGQIVEEVLGSDTQFLINLSDLTEGIYTLQVQKINGEFITKQFLKH